MMSSHDDRLVLLTGATGYVGGRLLPVLAGAGYRVRCLVRQARRLRPAPGVEVVEGDLLDDAALARAFQGVGAAYFLVHSLGRGADFEERDRRLARAFARVAAAAGVGRLIYLGGLGGGRLSSHLASRQEVGEILRASGVPTLELRASIIIGAGSLSFEVIRALVERLPVMVTPRWVHTLAQPIAIDDVIAYLVAGLTVDLPESRVIEIGGPDRRSYRDLLHEYARQRGLRRLIVPVPVLTPWLSSLWLGLVTPLQAPVGRRLIEGVRSESVVRDPAALALFPIHPRPLAQAMREALAAEERELAGTRWSEVLGGEGRVVRRWAGPRIVESMAAEVAGRPEEVLEAVQCHFAPQLAHWLWRLRLRLDPLFRPFTPRPAATDSAAGWRLEAYQPGRLRRLVSTLHLPGRAWLQYETDPVPRGTALRQTLIFEPRGALGLAYWYAFLPLHHRALVGLLGRLVRVVREAQRRRETA
jgi:uncharacterized protein YbjT (DUF2867 family)